MQLEEVIAQAIEEGKSLTTNEREKAAGPYDADSTPGFWWCCYM